MVPTDTKAVDLLKEVSPRNCWPMGRVCEVYISEDNLVRKVKVEYALSRNKPKKVIK